MHTVQELSDGGFMSLGGRRLSFPVEKCLLAQHKQVALNLGFRNTTEKLRNQSFPELNSSLLDTCDTLSTILALPDSSEKAVEVTKHASSLCSLWFQMGWDIRDDQITSEYHAAMIMSNCLLEVLRHYGQAEPSTLPEQLQEYQIPLVLLQVLMQTLHQQNLDGSWGSSLRSERTACVILTLAKLACLPLDSTILNQVHHAVKCAQAFLESRIEVETEFEWSEKIAYSASTSQSTSANILEAISAKISNINLGTKSQMWWQNKQTASFKSQKTLSKLLHLGNMPTWKIVGISLEAHFFSEHARQFGAVNQAIEDPDRYRDIADNFWNLNFLLIVCANYLSARFMPAQAISDLGNLLSLLWELDDDSEVFLPGSLKEETGLVREMIDALCGPTARRFPSLEAIRDHELKAGLKNVQHLLESRISWVLNHPSVKRAPKLAQDLVRRDLHVWLVSEVTQVEEAMKISQQCRGNNSGSAGSAEEIGSYYHWVQTTGVATSGIGLVEGFLHCLLTNSKEPVESAAVAYIVQDLRRHTAIKVRTENDLESFSRDEENNLNSLHFAEFKTKSDDATIATKSAKTQLVQIIEYEKMCFVQGMERLEGAVMDSTRNMDVLALKFIYSVSELYIDVFRLRGGNGRNNSP